MTGATGILLSGCMRYQNHEIIISIRPLTTIKHKYSNQRYGHSTMIKQLFIAIKPVTVINIINPANYNDATTNCSNSS